MDLGEALLALDQPGLALEVLDEAMECAIATLFTENNSNFFLNTY